MCTAQKLNINPQKYYVIVSGVYKWFGGEGVTRVEVCPQIWNFCGQLVHVDTVDA